MWNWVLIHAELCVEGGLELPIQSHCAIRSAEGSTVGFRDRTMDDVHCDSWIPWTVLTQSPCNNYSCTYEVVRSQNSELSG